MQRLIFFLVLTGLVLNGCTLSSQKQVNALADTAGFEHRVVTGDRFEHVIWLSNANSTGNRLHVYLEGDGTPWIRQIWPASDPTPKKPLMLELMREDPSHSLYLGRPCYFGLAYRPPCEALYWTHARYSKTVVKSMQLALMKYIRKTGITEIVFVGHSGGGALAMLLAERFSQTRAVITIAGNLDIERWAKLHGYEKLLESLNPADLDPLPADIYQLHLAGGNDHVVPPPIIEPVVDSQFNAHFRIVDNYTHACCWLAVWPEVLAELERETRTPSVRRD
jgi:pimeloyl-ACP methyl ester carboxylesterase